MHPGEIFGLLQNPGLTSDPPRNEVTQDPGLPLTPPPMPLNIVEWTDYTPVVTLVGGAGNTVPQYTTLVGRWARIGKTVFVSIQASGDGGNEGAGTGVLTLSLPVPAGSVIGSLNLPVGRLVNAALRAILFAQPAAGSSVISLTYFDTISTNSVVTGALQNDVTRGFSLHFFYEGASA